MYQTTHSSTVISWTLQLNGELFLSVNKIKCLGQKQREIWILSAATVTLQSHILKSTNTGASVCVLGSLSVYIYSHPRSFNSLSTYTLTATYRVI